MPRYESKKSLKLVFLIVLLLIAAGGAVYFYLDREMASSEIAVIDSFEYTDFTAEKGQQYEAKGTPLSATITEKLSDEEYQTPFGFSIISYSDKWKGEKLLDVYEELLNNMHGDEIMYVGEVAIYPGSSELDSDETQVAGTQSSRHDYYPVFFDMPVFIPATLKYSIRPKVSVIELYNMDEYDNAAQAAKTIAHEYGHHYTKYYFLKDDKSALGSQYYQLRSLKDVGHEVIFDTWKDYMDNYEWDIYELAAEDYVQLMGSPNAKVTREYMDGYDLLQSGKKRYKPDIDDRTINVFPQDNIYIPLADEIDGLRDYYYSFIGTENEMPSIGKSDFNIKMEKRSNNGYTYYNIKWTKTSTDKNALYTLVCFSSEGEPYWPVKTVKGNETPIARVGTLSNTYFRWSDGIPDEDRIFKLYLILPDGRMQSSEPFYADF